MDVFLMPPALVVGPLTVGGSLTSRSWQGGSPVDEVEFGRYRLIEVIGRGGMGEVWRAHDTGTDRIVAIKLLPANFSETGRPCGFRYASPDAQTSTTES
jgi:serine/threonine protein kinase